MSRLLAVFMCTALWQCKTTPAATVKVMGGGAPNTYPVQLIAAKNSFAQMIGTSTGFFVSDQIMITAAHCVDKTFRVYFEQLAWVPSPTSWLPSRVNALSTATDPDYLAAKLADGFMSTESAGYDAGVLKFAPGTAKPEQIAQFADTPPVVGQEVVLSGYGMQSLDASSAGVLATGYNRIVAIDDGTGGLFVVRDTNSDDPNNAISLWGDSGSALFDKKTGKVLGILSNVKVYVNDKTWSRWATGKDKSVTVAWYASIFNDGVRKFLTDNGVQLPPIVKSHDAAKGAADAADAGDSADAADAAAGSAATDADARPGGQADHGAGGR